MPGLIRTIAPSQLARLLAGSALCTAMLLPAAGWAAASDAGTDDRTDSVARLLAGNPPTHAGHAALARTAAWKEHARAMQASWSKVRDGQGAAVMAWRKTHIPGGCPVGSTLLYPFSGPDFLNAHWLFPDCATYVMFGLERPGEMPDIESLGPEQFAQLLASVRTFMINLFVRNYFVTDTMLRQTKEVRGMVPVLMVLMSLSGVEVLRVRKLELAPAALAPRPAMVPGTTDSRRRKRELRGVAIDFRRPGSPLVRRLNYFSLDATDVAIAGYPEFLEYLRGFAPTTTLIKSASYLLHGNEFSRMREAILDASAFIVQDDTGLPYARLAKRGWQMQLYGTYGIPIPPFEYAYQPALAASYEKQKPRPLPFRFGYHLNMADDRSNLMVARLPLGQARARPAPIR